MWQFLSLRHSVFPCPIDFDLVWPMEFGDYDNEPLESLGPKWHCAFLFTPVVLPLSWGVAHWPKEDVTWDRRPNLRTWSQARWFRLLSELTDWDRSYINFWSPAKLLWVIPRTHFCLVYAILLYILTSMISYLDIIILNNVQLIFLTASSAWLS